MKSIVLCLAVLVVGTAFVNADQSANQFIDQMLKGILGNKAFDPMVIPYEVKEVRKKYGMISVSGKLELFNTTITGFSKIHRNGDASLSAKDGVLDAKLKIKDEDIGFMTHARIELGHDLVHKKFIVEVNVGDIDINFQAHIGGSAGIKLELFDIDELKHVRVKVHELGPLDPIIDLIADAYIHIFNEHTRHEITKIVRPIIDDQIKHIHI